MTAQEDWTYTPEVIGKARRYLDQKAVAQDPDAEGVYWIKGSARRRYRVQTDARVATQRAKWINCTCPHGMNLGAGSARCSHAVAVLLAIRDHRDLPRYPEA